MADEAKSWHCLSTVIAAVAAIVAFATCASAAVRVGNRLLSDESYGTHRASYGRGFNEQHYSPLDQINDGNVGRLGLAWFYDLPPMASVFTALLAVNGVLYFAVGYSMVHAMDAITFQFRHRHAHRVLL